MPIADGWCVAGILNMRRQFPVPLAAVVKVKGRNAWLATCHVCGRPNTPVVYDGDVPLYSGHKESTQIDVYSRRRERNW